MPTEFIQQNIGWNAEPNAPEEHVRVLAPDVVLSFRPNQFKYPELAPFDRLDLRFANVVRYRVTQVNDHAWFGGQCRFSEIAPNWGEFYEVRGDFLEDLKETPWIDLQNDYEDARNFLFYFRDSTFETVADGWKLSASSAADAPQVAAG